MVTKTFPQRIQELTTALDSMTMSLTKIRNPEYVTDRNAHIYNLMSPLRALIAQGGKNFRPRLLRLAAETNTLLQFYAAPEEGLAFTWEVKIPAEHRSYFSPTGYAPNFIFKKCWSPKPKPGFRQTTLADWMGATIYLDGKREYTRNELLRGITDKDGGGHLDDTQDFLSYTLEQRFLSFESTDEESAVRGKDLFLIDLAALTTLLGKRMLLILSCREKGVDETQCEELNSLDRESDEFQVQHTGKFGWIMPRADSWGPGRTPPNGPAQGRLILSRDDKWWTKDYVYTTPE